jgi:uncharacterized protein (TIGR00251 family)
MKVAVKVKPGSRMNHISLENGEVIIRVKAPAHEGKANEELTRFLADILEIPRSQVLITGGHTAPYKRLDLPPGAAARLKALAAAGG